LRLHTLATLHHDPLHVSQERARCTEAFKPLRTHDSCKTSDGAAMDSFSVSE
jgi:hypothetical protein